MYVDLIRSSHAPNRLLADYNMDGYWDAIGVSVFVEGATSSQNAIFKGAEDYAFSRASGIWNTDLEFNSTSSPLLESDVPLFFPFLPLICLS